MVLRFVLIYDTMMAEAEKLGLPTKDLEAFSNCQHPLIDYEPTRAERAATKRVLAALNESPSARLEIAKTTKYVAEVSSKPSGNAKLHMLPFGYIEGIDPATYTPKDRPEDLPAIQEGRTRKPLVVSTSSSVGTLVSGDEAFRLYATLKDYGDPKKVYRNIGKNNGYPLKRIADLPAKMKRVNLTNAIKAGIPAFLFVGNRMPEKCSEALAYVSDRYCDMADDEGFVHLVGERAAMFAIHHVTNTNHVEYLDTIAELDEEIAELEKLCHSGV